MSFIISIIGALWRRVWGGWFSPNSAIKRIISVVLAAFTSYITFKLNYVCILTTASLVFAMLMPFHGFGIGMGRGSAQRKTWLCVVVMLAQYGGLTAITGVLWELLSPSTGGLIYIPMGCIVAIGYYASWTICDKVGFRKFGEFPKGNFFVDSPTCYGELVLGAVMFGGIPIAKKIQESLC